jgi:NAD(P)-dependent dehydrogenase (short-subunit alcohol dehydrogenase family)
MPNQRSDEMTQLLESKRAIIYGAGGGIGVGVARTFAAKAQRCSWPAELRRRCRQSPKT